MRRKRKEPTPPIYRCKVVVCPTYNFNVVQVAPSGRHCGICKLYFPGRKKWAKQLTWLDCVEICRKANLDRMNAIFGVKKLEVA